MGCSGSKKAAAEPAQQQPASTTDKTLLPGTDAAKPEPPPAAASPDDNLRERIKASLDSALASGELASAMASTGKVSSAKVESHAMAKGKKQKPVDSGEADAVDHSEESSGEYRKRNKAKKAKKAWPDGTSLAEEPKPDKTGKKRKAVEVLSAASEAPPAKAEKLTGPPAKAERVTADPKRGVFAGGIPRTSEESAVRTHFEQCGEIQEFKFPSNARGVRMGFVLVTFTSEKAVAKALKLTGSMFEGSKISVAIQENKERPAKSEKKKSGNVETCVRDGCSNAGDGSSQYCSISCMEAQSVVAAPLLKVAEQARGATNWSSLEKAILENGCTQVRDFQCLHRAVVKFGENLFFATLLPFICDEAASYADLFEEPIFVVDEMASDPSRTVEWSQRQCLCILCNAFLCAWPGRTSANCNSVEQPDLPSINFDEMMHSRGNVDAQVAKCEMFLHYVEKQHQRVQNGDLLTRLVTFVRSQQEVPNWQASQATLCPITLRPLRESIDAAKDLLRVDFANKSVGGASIAYGCVQEEIMFACHPELNCARLIFPRMRGNEAFILCGAEQFAEPAGYAFSLTCAGPYEDKSAVVDGRLRSFVTAIDAMDYRGHYAQGTHRQYSRPSVDRELQKAFAGFVVPKSLDAPLTLGTGNWGAGAFLGDASLKALVQWAAASEAGLVGIHYFPFDNEVLHRDLQRISESLIARGTTVRDLCAWLRNGSMQPGVPVLKQLNDAFQLGLEELGVPAATCKQKRLRRK